MTRLTTVQVGSGWFPEIAGGLNRYYFDLIKHLPAAGIDCRGLVVGSAQVAGESGGAVTAYAAAKAPILRRWRAGRSAARRLYDEVPRGQAAALVTHFALYAYPISPPRGWPTIVHFHGPYAAESNREGAGLLSRRIKAHLERSVYRRADQFIVLSEAFRDVLCRDYGVPPGRVAVIPGGVDIDRFRPARAASRAEARHRLGWPTERPLVLAVRRLVSRMGLESLIEAMAHVRRRVPDALCLIAGRGPLHEALSARIDAAGLNNHVRVLGFVPDAELPWAYRAADLSVVPSESLEGFGLSAIESLAAGTPVRVTPVGGLPEVVHELDSALLLPAISDTLPFAESLAASLLNSATLPSADACHAYVAERFGWPMIAGRVASVYRGVVKS